MAAKATAEKKKIELYSPTFYAMGAIGGTSLVIHIMM
jgi:hypothetical protein